MHVKGTRRGWCDKTILCQERRVVEQFRKGRIVSVAHVPAAVVVVTVGAVAIQQGRKEVLSIRTELRSSLGLLGLLRLLVLLLLVLLTHVAAAAATLPLRSCLGHLQQRQKLLLRRRRLLLLLRGCLP